MNGYKRLCFVKVIKISTLNVEGYTPQGHEV